VTPQTWLTRLQSQAAGDQPIAIVLAGHNGSGKSTFWSQRLADELQLPLINADRLTASLLPSDGSGTALRPWAVRLRDHDERWQRLAQNGVQRFISLVTEHRMSFAFETVFSYLEVQPDGSYKSKVDDIKQLQANGYFVILLFVGLATAQLSVSRVLTRKAKGGHDVPYDRLLDRFPRTQQAIAMAAVVSDLTLMFDNSRDAQHAFLLVRAQKKYEVVFDCRSSPVAGDPDLVRTAGIWLSKVAPLVPPIL
jgi:predicted ABC-type ATPase